MSSLVSEMRIDNDGTASFYLDRERMAVVVDLDQEAVELPRALDVLKQWQGRERLIAMLDMTTPDMAVVRLKTDLPTLEKAAVHDRANARSCGAGASQHRGARGGGAMRNMLAGLDVGTSKVCAIVAEVPVENEIAVLGYGVAPCTGLRKGVVVNIEATVEAIRAATEEAERSFGNQNRFGCRRSRGCAHPRPQ